jgi:hypothetical protein
MVNLAIQNVRAALAGDRPPSLINPEVLPWLIQEIN